MIALDELSAENGGMKIWDERNEIGEYGLVKATGARERDCEKQTTPPMIKIKGSEMKAV